MAVLRFAVLLVVLLAQAPSKAQILVSRLPTYFDDRVQDCTGPDHCDASTLGVLTGHFDEDGLYWGGDVSPWGAVRTAVCTTSSASMCLSWRVATAASGNASDTEVGECECEIQSSACAEHLSNVEAGGTLVAGNTSRFSNGECDLGNYNGVCGWDGGDCSGFLLPNGTALPENAPGPYELQGIGSDNFCAAWTCQLTSTTADSSCSSSRQRLRRSLHTATVRRDSARGAPASVERRALDCATSLVSAYRECACTSRSDNQLYCARWYCEVVDVSFTWTTSDGWDGLPLTREWSECLAPNADNSSCASWEVMSQGADESSTPTAITLSSCSCVADSEDDPYAEQGAADALFGGVEDRAVGQEIVLDPRFNGCRRWECDTDTYAVWEVSWALFGVAVGIGSMLALALVVVLPRLRPKRCSCPQVKERCVFLSVMIAVCGVPIYGVFMWMAVLAAGAVGAIVESILLFGPFFLLCGGCAAPPPQPQQQQQQQQQSPDTSNDLDRTSTAIQLRSVAASSSAIVAPLQVTKYESSSSMQTAERCTNTESNAEEERVPVAVVVDADVP